MFVYSRSSAALRVVLFKQSLLEGKGFVRLFLLLLALGLLVLAGCGGPQPPEIATPGQVSLVFFYTDG